MFHQRIVGIAAALTLSVSTIAAAQAQDFQFKANVVGNEEGIAYLSAKKFADVVAKESGGKVGIKLFHSSALGDQPSSLESMKVGTLDMATIETPITAVDPILGATALPYMFQSREHVAKALNGPAGEWIEKRLAAKGYRVVSFMEGGFRQITNNVRPIVTPADLKGVKMRTPGSKLRIAIFNHYGANASPLPFAELYTALQTGAFDGQENPVIWAKSTKFYEVQKYLSITNHLYTVTYLLMSEKAYGKLPKDLQAAVRKAGKAAADYSVELGIKADKEVVDFLKEKGMKVNNADVPSFVKASKAIWDDWTKENGEDAKTLIDLVQKSAK